MIVRFHPEAIEEALDAASWYENQEENLGDEFLQALEKAVAAITAEPTRYPFATKPYRVTHVRRFPFSIFYQVVPLEPSVQIHAVFHQKRRPGIWRIRTFGPTDPI